MIIHIDAPHFNNADVITEHNVVVMAPPSLRYMKGWKGQRVVEYVVSKGWTFKLD
jgi:hypothetical protein